MNADHTRRRSCHPGNGSTCNQLFWSSDSAVFPQACENCIQTPLAARRGPALSSFCTEKHGEKQLSQRGLCSSTSSRFNQQNLPFTGPRNRRWRRRTGEACMQGFTCESAMSESQSSQREGDCCNLASGLLRRSARSGVSARVSESMVRW